MEAEEPELMCSFQPPNPQLAVNGEHLKRPCTLGELFKRLIQRGLNSRKPHSYLRQKKISQGQKEAGTQEAICCRDTIRKAVENLGPASCFEPPPQSLITDHLL